MPNSRKPVFLIAVLLTLLTVSPAFTGEPDPQEFTQIEHGRYLATAADCISCHTIPGSKPFAGGRAIETPFGNIISANLTPDLDTGIGAWSDEAFDAAVRKGIGRHGGFLYPAMPYTAYAKLSRDDVLAIRAYLGSIEPVRNNVPPTSLPFPFNIRSGMRLWNALYFDRSEFKHDPSKSAEWNRGAYLVDGPAHCGACHTAKTFLGGDKTDQYLQGSYLQGWYAPNITNDKRLGLGNWTVEDIDAYLKTGHNRITAATGPMAEAVSLSTSHMTNKDTKAIATYLKSLPGKTESVAPLPKNSATMVAGGAIYRDQCSACHGLDGRGVANLFPAIADASGARSNDPTTSIRIVLRGARSVATAREPTSPGMPSYSWQLDDTQVADVLNYIRNSWGGAASPVEAKDVSHVRSDTAARGD
ncbi:cytochrome c [Bradyrhizobium sp. Ai1a-2]|uniref:c-type cytochrome n=1 Tax=Bradyrhizobium sp. Ai1a-2 TaxID=196490 RepID=UPI00042047E6|nr:cytochrome c [Bradyrhizobium sp. Ai1a-2]